MKRYELIVLLTLAVTTFVNCSNETKNTITIKDFRRSLQPHLIKVVSFGIVRSDSTTRFIQLHATDKELRQLSKCEHPVLRGVAFRAMLERRSFNHFEVIMDNLDDTAIIATDEWIGREGGGVRMAWVDYSTISDDIIRHGRWRDSNARNRTIEEVILKHNYLQSAYEKLLELDPKENYYSSIKQMLQRDKKDDELLGVVNFKDIERAIYALAKLERKEDILHIKFFLMNNVSRLSEFSFRLMQEYPNDEYLEICERIYPRLFYQRICNDQYDSNAEFFIRSIAGFRNERSARILDSILHKQPFLPCNVSGHYMNYLKRELVLAIWDNPCKAYTKMRVQIGAMAKQYGQERDGLESVRFLPPKSPEPISWGY